MANNSKPPESKRRLPRVKLDIDWFVESNGCSSMGRGVEVSLKSALLPATCTSPFLREVTLYLSLPERMLKLRAQARHHEGRGWVLQFGELSNDDLMLLAEAIIAELEPITPIEARFVAPEMQPVC